MDHKAFAVSDNGHFGYSYGQRNPELAVDLALQNCNKYAEKSPCKVIMVDGRRVE